MNAIPYAIQYISRYIPRQILRVALIPEDVQRVFPVTEEEALLSQVIRPIVLMDLSILTGQTHIIPLTLAETVQVNPYTYIYHIPNNLLHDRKINAVYDVGYIPSYNGYYPTQLNDYPRDDCTYSQVNEALQKLYDSRKHTMIPLIATTRLISSQTIMCEYTSPSPLPNIARVSLSHDADLRDISPKAYMLFGDLCFLAAKAHIHNTLLVQLDGGFIRHGAEYPTIKGIVEGYSEAANEYRELLNTKWRNVAALVDRNRHANHIRSMIPGNW